MDKTMHEKFERLQDFTTSLSLTVKDTLPNREQILDGKRPLPDNCPSKESMAELELSGIKKNLSEVVAAVDDIEKALFPNTAERNRGRSC